MTFVEDGSPPEVAELAQALAAEFHLGRPVIAESLGGSDHTTLKLVTPEGSFVAKMANRREDVALHARVAQFLNRQGVRQPVLRETHRDRWVGESGYFLQECVKGSVVAFPDQRRIAATMVEVARFHRALRELQLDWMPDEQSFWSKVTRVDYLLEVLPRQLGTAPKADGHTLETALAYLKGHRGAIGRLPCQLVHGDIGPDNVVMSGDDVVAIIDFTPLREPVLFAVGCAIFWYHIYPRESLDLDEISRSIEVCSTIGTWPATDRSLVPAMLVREALRRLATGLEAPRPLRPKGVALQMRWHALTNVIGSLGALERLVA